jgi:transposase
MRIKRDFAALEKRRLRAFALLEKGLSLAEVARRTNVSRQSVTRWNRLRLSGGKEALKAIGRAGRKPVLTSAQDAALAELLTKGPEAAGFTTPLWTLGRIKALILSELGVRCHETTVLRLLGKRLRWSCQKPIGRAIERNEPAIEHWKRKTWPALKKKPSSKNAR